MFRKHLIKLLLENPMIPIHQSLNRIRWDHEFARGSFQLGFYDRAENRVILVRLAK